MSKQELTNPSRSVWGESSTLKRSYERHSVETDVKSFVGWDTLLKIVETAKGIGDEGLRNAGFVATLFETGGRVSEALLLKPHMISVVKGSTPKLIQVTGMPLLKRYKKVGVVQDAQGKKHYQTKHTDATRDIAFRVDEPLVRPMGLWFVEAVKRKQYDWLFPSPYKHDAPLSRKWAYQLIEEIGSRLGLDLWPHWFRSQRACQMFTEYDFRESSLLEWFEWKSWEIAKKYTKLGALGLAKKMGVKFRKDRGLKTADIERLLVK